MTPVTCPSRRAATIAGRGTLLGLVGCGQKGRGRGQGGRVRHQANRYQLTDEGLNHEALPVGMTTFQARKRTEG